MRGLAILAIVLLHSANAMLNRGLAKPLSPAAQHVGIATDILFHNSTIYFALISGILYAHLFAGRPQGRSCARGLPMWGPPIW